jgi:hypothetical protein
MHNYESEVEGTVMNQIPCVTSIYHANSKEPNAELLTYKWIQLLGRNGINDIFMCDDDRQSDNGYNTYDEDGCPYLGRRYNESSHIL